VAGLYRPRLSLLRATPYGDTTSDHQRIGCTDWVVLVAPRWARVDRHATVSEGTWPSRLPEGRTRSRLYRRCGLCSNDRDQMWTASAQLDLSTDSVFCFRVMDGVTPSGAVRAGPAPGSHSGCRHHAERCWITSRDKSQFSMWDSLPMLRSGHRASARTLGS
jgi:hypothetical protein